MHATFRAKAEVVMTFVRGLICSAHFPLHVQNQDYVFVGLLRDFSYRPRHRFLQALSIVYYSLRGYM